MVAAFAHAKVSAYNVAIDLHVVCVLLCLARIGQALKREKAECGALPGAAIGDDVTFLNLAISLEYSSQLILVGAIIKIENCERVRLFATTAAATATVRA